jgi:aspartate-semialdehyde dehydrogenase
VATISVVGGETLLGREIREGLEKAGLRAVMQLIGASDESASILAVNEEEPAVVAPMDERLLRASDVVVSAASASGTAKAWSLVEDSRNTFIDLNGTLENDPGARLRAPLTEDARYAGSSNLLVVAHPAAVVLASLLSRLHRSSPIRQSVVQVFEPASERGAAGLHELQQQVTSLLSFRALEKRVFDAQLAFNMLVRYGEDAPDTLADAESRIERHLATLLAGNVPMPSLRLVQAPVFHGYSFSIWVEFETRPSAQAAGEAIASAQIDVRGADLEPPNNVGVAGQSGLAVGSIEPDRTNPRAMWLWAAADNYQVTTDNAVALVQSVLGAE